MQKEIKEQPNRIKSVTATELRSEKIASFKVDHEKLDKGIYISRRDDDAVTVDLRMRKPYADELISNSALHSLEHTLATRLRFGEFPENVLYVGPMGCQTGFYCIFKGLSDSEMLKELKDAFYYIAFSNTVMPGATKQECGNCLNLSVAGAAQLAKEYYDVIKDKRAFDLYPV